MAVDIPGLWPVVKGVNSAVSLFPRAKCGGNAALKWNSPEVPDKRFPRMSAYRQPSGLGNVKSASVWSLIVRLGGPISVSSVSKEQVLICRMVSRRTRQNRSAVQDDSPDAVW